VAPADGLLQISLRQQAQAIAELQTGAEQATKAEDWPLAIQHYDKLLALDPTLVFATTGLTQARQRLELDETLNTYLQAPQLMRDDPALEQAKASVIAASRTTSKGPRLQRQINDLSQLVALARIPLQLVLTSDGMTDVTVYKVGNFGKLARQELSLVPGIYTIVGKRPGYRDIKQQLTLAGGANPTAVHISCVEKI
jgi:eukaryotic-like serine/threonine-protein kinase